MLFLYPLVTCMCLLIHVRATPLCVEENYVLTNHNQSGVDNIIKNLTLGNRSECAVLCHEANCVTFTFSEVSGHCILHSQLPMTLTFVHEEYSNIYYRLGAVPMTTTSTTTTTATASTVTSTTPPPITTTATSTTISTSTTTTDPSTTEATTSTITSTGSFEVIEQFAMEVTDFSGNSKDKCPVDVPVYMWNNGLVTLTMHDMILFEHAVIIREIHIYASFNTGGITIVGVKSPSGNSYEYPFNSDAAATQPELRTCMIAVDYSYASRQLYIEVAPKDMGGPVEIDAVKIVGELLS